MQSFAGGLFHLTLLRFQAPHSKPKVNTWVLDTESPLLLCTLAALAASTM